VEIQGPFTISINDNNETGLRELQLGFKPAFQQLNAEDRLTALREYISALQKDIEAETDTDNQQGMMTIQQVAEQLLPHLEADEIPMDEIIVIEIGPGQTSPFDDLLRGATLK